MEIDEGKVCSLNNQCANGFLMCFFLFLFLTSVIIIIRFSIYLAKTKKKIRYCIAYQISYPSYYIQP